MRPVQIFACALIAAALAIPAAPAFAQFGGGQGGQGGRGGPGGHQNTDDADDAAFQQPEPALGAVPGLGMLVDELGQSVQPEAHQLGERRFGAGRRRGRG